MLSRWLRELGQDLLEITVEACIHEIGHGELRLARHARVDLADVR